MRYWIRHEDLKTANYCDNYDCPLARAVKRKHPLVHVQVNSRYVFMNGKAYHIATPSADKLLSWSCKEIILDKGFHVRLSAA
jgi:hypothetical protein